MTREEFVRQQLELFARKYDDSASLSALDEVVLSYAVSVLEELGGACAVDVEDFSAMLEDYLPALAQLDSGVISEWMFELSLKLANFDQATDCVTESCPEPTSSTSTPGHASTTDPTTPPAQLTPTTNRERGESCGSCGSPPGPDTGLFTPPPDASSAVVRPRKSSSSRSDIVSAEEGGAEAADGDDGEDSSLEQDRDVRLLLELFPAACALEVAQCMAASGGDVEVAAQLMLHRQESGQPVAPKKGRSKKSGRRTAPAALQDCQMKQHIVSKYSYVDVDEDKKEHRPVLQQQGGKKLVRYLDGRVVSTRGERFTEIKNPEEEEKMKKTYINLKPAKQYRFH